MSFSLRSSLFDLVLLALAVSATTVAVGAHFGSRVPREGTPAALAEALAGKRLPPLPTYSTDGALVDWVIPADARRRLVLVFNSTCPYCEISVPAWKHMAGAVNEEMEVYLVNDQSIVVAHEWLERNGINIDATVLITPPGALARWGVPGFPSTLLLEGDAVAAAQFGAVTTADLSQWELAVK